MSERPQYPIDDYLPLMERVRHCEATSRAIRIAGGCTVGFDARSVDATTYERIDTTPLSALVDHAAADMTVTVQAGMTIAALQTLLSQKNQQLPIDVPDPTRTTVGGMIATNLPGSRRLSRGTVRDLLIGVAVVGAGGSLIRGGGRVVKNVAGYDLCKLYTGSWGWLGVIVEATFKVAARPEVSAALSIAFDDADSLESVAAELLAGPLQPTSLDLFAGPFDQLRHNSPSSAIPIRNRQFVLVVGFEGLQETVNSQLARCTTLINSQSPNINAPNPITLDADSYAACRRSACDLLLSDGCVRIGLLSSQTAQFVAEVNEKFPNACIAAHLGSGVVNIGIDPSTDELRRLVDAATRIGGHWLLPRFDASPAIDMGMLGPPRPHWNYMRKIKQALDPAAIFNRGSGFDRVLGAPL